MQLPCTGNRLPPQAPSCHQPYHHRVATDSEPSEILQALRQPDAGCSMSLSSELLGICACGRRPLRQHQGQLADSESIVALSAHVRWWLRPGACGIQLETFSA